jgi:uncharacterized protein (TIGR02246 family)
MSEALSIETRLARLEGRHAISDLVTRYAVACDEHDMPGLERLFTHDAVFDTPNGTMQAHGRDQILAMFDTVLAIRGPGYHWTHDHLIRFDQGAEDQASGVIFCHAETSPNGVHSLAALRYDDLYRIEAGTWRIARREIRFLYYVPAADYVGALTRKNRVAAGDRHIAADYPEALPSWQAFDARHAKTP